MEILIGAAILAAVVYVIVRKRGDSKPGTGTGGGGKNSGSNSNTQLK